jgi:hypothetical protein
MEPLEPRLLLDGVAFSAPGSLVELTRAAFHLGAWPGRAAAAPDAPTGALDAIGPYYPEDAALLQLLPPVPADALVDPGEVQTLADEPLPPAAGSGVFDVYVEPGLLGSIQASIDQYRIDLTAEGYTVAVEEFSGSAEALRALLQQRYDTANLEGALFVGDLPTLTYTHDNDFNGSTVSFIHDLYFMDLDGTYVLNDSAPDEHYDGEGDIEPEIYVSRITTSTVTSLTGRSEAELINEYFAKAHAYRTGQLTFQNRGILWSDDDWQWTSYYMGGTDLYEEILNVRDPAETTRQSYVDCLGLDYESMFDMIHSSVTYHSIRGTGSGTVNSTQIRDLNPRQGFYNLWNCSSAKFTVSSNLICTYVYGGDYGLNAVGSTKTGSMLRSYYFYRYQGAGHSVGQAFHYWFNNVDNSGDSYKSWHYGMAMQGDPTLRPATMGDAGLVANAGADRDALLGETVLLDGSGSYSSGGGGLEYLWEQVSGPAVTIDDAEEAVASFTPTAVGDHVFRLTVRDGELTSTDEVTIHVRVSAPTGVDLLPQSDTGAYDNDDLTRFDNSDPARALAFLVSGTVPGATVRVYAGGSALGSAVAGGTTAIVTTDGATGLSDGQHAVTARQQEPGKPESGDSPSLVIQIDTISPQIESASASGSGRVVAVFSDNLERSSAQNASNYDLGLPIQSAALDTDLRTVTLTLAQPMTTGESYTLTVSGVTDPAGNAITPGSQAAFTYSEVDADLLVWWKFDEGTGYAAGDATGHGRDGDVQGATWAANGRIGGALWFDGVDDQVVDEDGEDYINDLDAVTVALWIRSEVTQTDRGFLTTREPGSSDCLNIRYDRDGYYGDGTDLIKLYLQTDVGKRQNEGASNTQTTDWQHVALTWTSGERILLYVDGALQTYTDDQGARDGTIRNADRLIVGTGYKTSDGVWRGLIDDVRIYRRALDAQEVAALVNLAPVALDDEGYQVEQGNTLEIGPAEGVLANDHDPDGGPQALAASLVRQPEHGTVALHFDGSFEYTPVVGYVGPDSFAYEAFDGLAYSEPAEVSVTVTADQDPFVQSAYAMNSIQVVVVFSEDVSEASAEALANYRLDGGLTVERASLCLDLQTVLLTLTGPMTDGRIYTLTVSNVTDLTGNPIAANSQESFEYVGWLGQDVGDVAAVGSHVREAGVWTIDASGRDIWDNADEFHYVYRADALAGDGEILARVASLTDTDDWAKAGVMIRGTLAANSPHASTVVTPGNGVCFQRRLVAGDGSRSTIGNHYTAPYWVRLVRQGDTFHAYMSPDGEQWTFLGSDTVEMAEHVFVGLAVTSHVDGTLTTAVIDNVRVFDYDEAEPTAVITDVAPDPRSTSVAAMEIAFDRPVNGLDLGDLRLTRGGGPDLLTGSQWLTTSDRVTWTLRGLTALTAADGQYTLTLRATESGITDILGNPLQADASSGWLTDATGPTIEAWYSAAEHDGGVGEALLEIPDDGSFTEPRDGGITRLVIRFSEPVPDFAAAALLLLGNDSVGPINLSGVAWMPSSREDGRVGVLDFAEPLPDIAKYLIRIDGVSDALGNPLAGDSDRILTALIGDTSGDQRVNATDLSRVRAARTTLVDAGSADQVRADVSTDGRVNATDLSRVRAYRPNNAQAIPPPVFPAEPGSWSLPDVRLDGEPLDVLSGAPLAIMAP